MLLYISKLLNMVIVRSTLDLLILIKIKLLLVNKYCIGSLPIIYTGYNYLFIA